jgi:hypothetical protein
MVGNGANRKSLFDLLSKSALKEYMQTAKVALIIANKRGEYEAPSSVMATCMGAFLVMMQEAGLGETINHATPKKLAAGD